MTVLPTQPRYSLDFDGSSLRLKIPSRKHWFQIIFITVWAIFWLAITLGVVGSMIRTLFSGTASKGQATGTFSLVMLLPGLFFLVWLTVWSIGGLSAIYTVLSQIAGYELVEISPEMISIQRKVIGIEKPKTYDASYIKDLRVSPYIPRSSWLGSYPSPFLMRNTGMLAFDYGAKTIRFGNMEEAEAKMALTDILRRCPRYRKG